MSEHTHKSRSSDKWKCKYERLREVFDEVAWTDARKEHPEPYTKVLVYGLSKELRRNPHKSNKWSWLVDYTDKNGEWKYSDYVTHWMPLPDAPSGVDECLPF